jgi:hypothetical protein
MTIQETTAYLNLDNLQRKVYTSKIQIAKINHLLEVAKNRGVQFMISTQHPNSIQLAIVKEIINDRS